jgi:hypothetical protein
MIRNKPKLPPGLKGLPNQWISSANATNTAAANTIANSIIKFKDYWSEDDAKKLINAYSRLKNKISNNSKRAGIKTVINSILPEGNQILDTREGVRVVSGSPSKKRSRNNATPTQNQASAMNTNNRTKLSKFMNKLNRLTENNKKTYLNQLNTSGSTLNNIKNAAYDTHRIREFRTKLGKNINALSANQLANYEQKIRNDRSQGVLQRVFNNAKRVAQRVYNNANQAAQRRGTKRSRQGP